MDFVILFANYICEQYILLSDNCRHYFVQYLLSCSCVNGTVEPV